MSAAELQKAAETLRARAEAATTPDEMHPWGDESLPSLAPEEHPNEVRAALGGTWGDYYATVHPGVGLALADLLDRQADEWEAEPATCASFFGEAIRLARLINGGAA